MSQGFREVQSTVYNIGSGYSTSIQDIVREIYNWYNIEYIPKSKQSKEDQAINFWADISKIKKELGWGPKIGIHEGIKKMIFSYENNINHKNIKK